MKQGIHPKYYKATITCGCGATYEIGSTKGESFRVDVCANCHPFYTGQRGLRQEQGGRIERFRKRYGNTATQ